MAEPLYSRPTSHPFGPCDTEVKVALPERVKDELAALAVMHRLTTSEYLRKVITDHLYGHLEAVRVVSEHATGRAGNGRET